MSGDQRVSISCLSLCLGLHKDEKHNRPRPKLGLLVLLFTTCLIGLSLENQSPNEQQGDHVMMDGGNDTRPRAASSQPEWSGLLDNEDGIQRGRRQGRYDWPWLVDEHNEYRWQQKASNMEFMGSLKPLVGLQ